jgi:uncharacterized SAM-binding protein YcdF (DUF218 family)
VRRLVPVFAFLLAVWLVWAVVLFVVHHDGDPIQADAVVVLQGSKTRLPLGYRMMQEGYAPLMVISRGSGQKLEDRLCEGETRFEVVCFSASSTRGEARNVARLARERGLRRLDVVTSQFHVYRAQEIFERCYDGTLRMVGSPQQWWKLPKYMLSESAKLAYQGAFSRGC